MSHELTAYLSLFDLILTQLAILSKEFEPYNFKSPNSLKLSFTNIWGLCSNFVEYESFFDSNFPNILGLCETHLDDSIDSGNFSLTDYLPLKWKDSISHVHGLAVYVKEGLPFAWGLSLENTPNSYLCFQLLYFSHCLTCFSSIDHFLCLLQGFLFYFIKSDEVMFVFRDFKVHHKDWLTAE